MNHLATLAFLDGCEFAGADMNELDDADAVNGARERFASEIRRAVVETPLDPFSTVPGYQGYEAA
jgi:hypothetical protein